MADLRALTLLTCLCVLCSLGAGAAWGDGYRFGGWRFGGPFFGGPRLGPFAGPRYDGPPAYELQPPPDERIGLPATPPPVPPAGASVQPDPPAAGRQANPPPAVAAPHGPRKCYTAAETRERVANAKLRDPFALMRKASAMTQSEALAGKLCRWNDQDIYEISLLRHDGMLIRVFMNAATGQVLEDLKTR